MTATPQSGWPRYLVGEIDVTSTRAPPVRTIRLGRMKANVWANETENGIRHNVTLHIGYKEGDQLHWPRLRYQAARAL